MNRLQISDRIWRDVPDLSPLAGHWRSFTSAEAWAWYMRGCPAGEAVWEPGILDFALHNSACFINNSPEWQAHLATDGPNLSVVSANINKITGDISFPEIMM